MKMASVLLLGLAVVVSLSGCGNVQGERPSVVGEVSLEVSGGFTGWDRIVRIDKDGGVTIQVLRGPAIGTSRAKGLDKDSLKTLQTLVASTAFAELESAYLPPAGGADEQDYLVGAEVGGKVLVRRTRDGANIPNVLAQVLAVLNAVLAGGV